MKVMNKEQFYSSCEVQDFVRWLGDKLPNLPVSLKIKKSRFVKNGLHKDVRGIESVLSEYQWNGNWEDTKKVISKLKADLRKAIESNDHELCLQACDEILKWGGDRNRNVGAYKFLSSKNDLPAYLNKTAAALTLSVADLNEISSVEMMNSMLTKVHAFNSGDGLPIYDSRVASAIAALVEIYRIDAKKNWVVIPDELKFAAVSSSRCVLSYFKDPLDPGLIMYDTQLWTKAKIQLGWLMQLILEKKPDIFSNECSLSERMHAFEAALFMIGYNSSSILDDVGFSEVEQEEIAKKIFKGYLSKNSWNVQACDEIFTLKKSKSFYYADDEVAYHFWTGDKKSYGFVRKELVEKFIAYLVDKKSVKLGADMTKKYEAGEVSLGLWLVENKVMPTRRYASHLAAILVHEEKIRRCKDSKSIVLMPVDIN